jgi:peptide/nickel transport system substrate-binding protein
MSRVRLGVTLLAAAALALGLLGPASARTDLGSRYGGTLVVGLAADPGSLDPTTSTAFAAVVVYRTICEKLYDLGARAEVVPQLATALPVVSKDKLSYTIRLRKGVVFNDGTPFDASAVVTSLQRHMSLDGSIRASDLEAVDGVSARGPYTVVLRLKSRFTPLADKLATDAAAIMSPAQLAKLGARFGSDPVCVGPFMFDHRVASESVTVIKSPHYYNRNAVYLDKIVFKVPLDSAAAAAALKAGDMNVLDNVSETQLEGLAQGSSLRIIKKNQFGFGGVRFNIGNENGIGNLPYASLGTPFASSAKLRKAFEEAIDRTALGRVLFGGNVQRGCMPISPASSWFDATVKCTPYDPADARKLVRASGIANPTVRLLTSSNTDVIRLAQFIQAQEAAVGIDVVIDVFDNATVAARLERGNFDAHVMGWNGRSEPDHNIYSFLATSGSRNFGGYSNTRLDLILENGRKATKTEARRTLYRAAQQIILDDRPIIYLYHPIKFVAMSTEVAGVYLNSDLSLRVAFAQLR